MDTLTTEVFEVVSHSVRIIKSLPDGNEIVFSGRVGEVVLVKGIRFKDLKL